MMKSTLIGVAFCLAVATSLHVSAEDRFAKKPAPDEIIEQLKAGNQRFVAEKSIHPNIDAARRIKAAKGNQGDYALATILSCADSRVPVELIFDAGVMDLFVMRTAGNVCPADEAGTIEFGIVHVNTPVLLVLGHSHCGAVNTALGLVEKRLQIDDPANKVDQLYNRNILGILLPIVPAVEHVLKNNPKLTGQELADLCIRENVYFEIGKLLRLSDETREAVVQGKVKVCGGVYDIGSGKVEFLDNDRITKIVKHAEATAKTIP